MGFLILVSTFFILCHTHFTTTSRIRIENNGYENILVSLPSEAAESVRKSIVSSLKDLFQDSSSFLSLSTKRRAHFRSVTFLVPRSWGEMDSWLPNSVNTTFDDAGAAVRRQEVDVVVQHSSENVHPYVLHQGSCGRRALRMYLPINYLMSGDRRQKGVEFVRLWSEFRYGVFLEGGFEDDPKYPYLYQVPGDSSNISTGCSSELYRQCKELGKCSDDITSSLMDQHLPNTAIHFCENFLNLGPRHNPDAPSKHNLLCNEEGTWFTVLRSQDFYHGRNAASKSPSNPEVTYRFVREVFSPRVIVAIDVSSQMNKENRYHLTKNAFSQFVISMLPDDSDLSVLLFGGAVNTKVVTSNVHLTNDDARTRYLESLPLPDEPLPDDYTCIDCLLEDIIELVANENSTFESAPIVILVTSEHRLDTTKFKDIQKKLQTTEILLQVMAFNDAYHNESQGSLYDLCLETGNKFINLEGDTFSNLYNSFHQAVKGPISNIMIYQNYLITLDEENVKLPFVLDESAAQELQVSISGPLFHASSTLEYDKTLLIDPSGNAIQSKKYELVPSLNFHIRNPKAGVYALKTRRKRKETSPVLVSIYGTPVSGEDPISVNAWVEISNYKVSPPPIQIFAEVRKGSYPIKNATVKAYIWHPGGYVEVFHLFDDGLGSVDVTEGDGVYSHYFTNFTSIGFYNVKVTGESDDYSVILKGPSTYCCGSSFPSIEEVPTGPFRRQSDPVTFRVTIVPEDDHYPPARVTDLRVVREFRQIIVLKWTSIGNDFDSGEAAAYELKLFRDRSLVQNRFSDSGLELYSETIEVTSPTSYGTDLFHVLQTPSSLGEGVYYIGIRGLDNAGNAGEPSNTVAVWIGNNKSTTIDCSDEPIAEKINSSYRQSPFAFFIIFMICFIFL